MKELEALLLDVDGTLADSERDGHRVAFNLAFREAGLDWAWSPELYGELLAVAGGKERIAHYIERYRPPFDPPRDLPGFVAALHRAKTAHYTRMVKQGALPLRPGVRRLIMEARSDGLRLGVATTTSPDNVEALLEHSLAPGSSRWFEVLACGDVVPAKKPAPDIYLYALERMALPPEACVALEDSENGLAAARGARIPTLVTVSSYTRGQRFDGALAVLDTLGEPARPFEVIAGDVGDARCVDLALVRRLHARAVDRQAR